MPRKGGSSEPNYQFKETVVIIAIWSILVQVVMGPFNDHQVPLNIKKKIEIGNGECFDWYELISLLKYLQHKISSQVQPSKMQWGFSYLIYKLILLVFLPIAEYKQISGVVPNEDSSWHLQIKYHFCLAYPPPDIPTLLSNKYKTNLSDEYQVSSWQSSYTFWPT